MPRSIAPAVPSHAGSGGLGANGDSSPSPMPYSCQPCAKRKVKCDKTTPTCHSCRRGKLECIYQAPQPRLRKRKLSNNIHERLAQYEQILRQHGLLPRNSDTSSLAQNEVRETISIQWNGHEETSRAGKLLAGKGKSRYISSDLWRSLGDDAMQRMFDDEEEDQEEPEKDDVAFAAVAGGLYSDPLTGAFMGAEQNLLGFHPSRDEAMFLWQTHAENVEPLCKVLHIPSVTEMVSGASRQPETVSRADECLLFAIYHFAVYSTTEDDCSKALGQSRATLLRRFRFATRQALVNVSFLKTTNMTVLQALVLFLLSSRHSCDAHTYWILTGVAVRIGQRLGLHRDGELLGLPPFEVQMRRRLFYQILPIDGFAGQMSGTGISAVPDDWDTKKPLNVNDHQIWPGMTEQPESQKGATDMIFCLARSTVGNSFGKAKRSMKRPGTDPSTGFKEAELVIDAAEADVEEMFIRYCDIINPLHFLTVGSARAGIIAMRIQIRLPKIKDRTATDAERREVFHLALKIMDTDTAAYAHESLRRYMWHIKPFFLWGSWDSLILILTSLCRPGLLSTAETDAAWKRMEEVYNNHDLLNLKRALHIAFGRLALRAWAANPPTRSLPEPNFIISLCSLLKVNLAGRSGVDNTNLVDVSAKMDTMIPVCPVTSGETDPLFVSLSNDFGDGFEHDFNLDSTDWMFWDQLIREDQAQGDQHQPGIS
ncbi:uncharacterized protein JN550_005255 [Neoarthrinium moseri]|uniref:uncharacterized protein n=1 Tax=Neoarthrinium moseri TaxID=1658444 RepID=UPI001FDB1D5D|nr:uncharacterized protein JN550_005255 [Neoarthrinium moseri]KAI1870327.1 hypothetical protein JN550_005255 [Neoarthrinium moseri]